VGGLAAGRRLVDRQMVFDVARDFDLGPQAAATTAATTAVVETAAPAAAVAAVAPVAVADVVQSRRFAFFGVTRPAARKPLSIVNEPS
jgi:hypothetical protein